MHTNTMVSVEILVQRELEDASTALPQDDGAAGEEEDPDAVPAFTTLGDDLSKVSIIGQSGGKDARTFSWLSTKFKYHFHMVAL